MCAWFFPKGRKYQTNYDTGHRYYWSYAIVWTDNPNPDYSTVLSHAEETPPDYKFVVDGTTIKFDSYFSFWALRQATTPGETQDLITWEQLSNEARDALSEADFGSVWTFSEVPMSLKDGVFTSKLKKAYPF